MKPTDDYSDRAANLRLDAAALLASEGMSSVSARDPGSMPPDMSGEYRALLLRFLENVIDDVKELAESIRDLARKGDDTDRTARSAFLRVEQVEDDLNKLREEIREQISELERKESASAVTLGEIRGVAKGAGLVWGLISGALVSILVAILSKVLGL